MKGLGIVNEKVQKLHKMF